MIEPSAGRRRPGRILLASSRGWLATSLSPVLEPEGFDLRHVRSGALAIREALADPPDIVLLDAGLSDGPVSELCRAFAGRLRGVPILVYSPSLWADEERSEALRAGAWEVLAEPVRPGLLIMKLRRLIHIKRLIEVSNGMDGPGDGSRALRLGELLRILRVLGSLAARERRPLGCAVLGPTSPAQEPREAGSQRRATSRLIDRNTRGSDISAWVGETDLALVAYGADLERLRRIMGRLGDLAGSSPDPLTVSAGLVTLEPDLLVEGGPAAGEMPAERFASLSGLAAARGALHEARSRGGGVRSAEV